MRIATEILATTLLAAPLCCQMAGTYAVDPAAPGAFPSVTAAVNTLVAQGVAGPVVLAIAPGTYIESVLVPPIPGATPTSTVTFRAAQGAGTVVLKGSTGDTVALLASSFDRNRALVFEDLVFDGGPGNAISATAYVEDIEIRGCRFEGGHTGGAPLQLVQAVIRSQNAGDEVGWRVHHNHIAATAPGFYTKCGIAMFNAGGWEIHHNTFDVNDANHAIYMVNNATREDRIYDNVFYGVPVSNGGNFISSVSVIRADSANYENWITHNTFAIDFPPGASLGCCIASGGTTVAGGPAQNYLYGNLYLVRGFGLPVVLNVSGGNPNPIQSDGNIYFAPSSATHRIGGATGNNTAYTLASWQTTTGQDAQSQFIDPQLRAPWGTSPDLHPTAASPILGAATNTPTYVTDDLDGRLRDAAPDAGAYESSGFAAFGSGCAGTAQLEPAIAGSGAVALGSATFAIDLSQALPLAPAILVGGDSRDQWLGAPLPFDLGGACQLLVAPLASIGFVVSSTGTASAPLPIPNLPGLFGTDLFFQWAVLDPASASTFGVAVSAGGALQV